MSCSSGTGNHGLQAGSGASSLTYSVSNPRAECEEYDQSNEETAIKNEENVITSILATDLGLGLGRIPAGFYVAVHHSGLGWRTDNRSISVSSDVVDWSGPIPLPSDPSANVSLIVWASFELQPMLGDGEQLRELSITMEKLLDHSVGDLPFAFSSEDEVSPCSSIRVTVRQRNHEGANPSSSRVLEPYFPALESRSELDDATNKGHNAFTRYQNHGEKQDLEHAIEQFQRALDICPLDDPCYAAAQSNAAMVKLVYCQVCGSDASFDVPLALYHSALTARPAGHPDRPRTLIQLATVHLAQFKKGHDEADVMRAEAFLREAMDLSSAENYENWAVLSILQTCAESRAGAVQTGTQSSVEQASSGTDVDPRSMSLQPGNLADLQQVIPVLEAFIRSASIQDDRYLAGLTKLATALRYRFNHLGEPSDLEECISRQQDAVNLIPDGHPNEPRFLNNLGIFLFARFEHLGRLSDLEDAILRQRHAFGLTFDGHPDRLSILNNLGNSISARFHCFGELNDLEEAISRQRDIVNLVPDANLNKLSFLNNLGISLKTRFEYLGEMSDLEEAILRQRDALDLIPDGHPSRPGLLNNLGRSLFARFQHLGELNDVEEAILKQRDAVDLTFIGHPNRLSYLNNLGNSFFARFEHLGNVSDLKEAISRQQDALDLTPDSHPNKPIFLSTLGNSFRIYFEHFRELKFLEDAISRQQEAVQLIPDDHPKMPSCLINLGNSLLVRFEYHGELSDLEQAISKQRDAVNVTPDGHPDKPSFLNSLGNSLATRFEHLGESSDLEEAISREQNAVGLAQDGHPDKHVFLNSLGRSFNARFKYLGEPSDLEAAISRHQDAVSLTPAGHRKKQRNLDNLATALLTRFERLGELADLEDAILSKQEAIGLIPDGHPDKPTHLSNLGVSFLFRFQRFGNLDDIEKAITRQQDAVDLILDGHYSKLSCLTNLGASLFTRFKYLRDLNDLEGAILRQREAVDTIPDRHPEKPTCLSNLGSSFFARFLYLGHLSDLEEAIARQRGAVDLTPDGHTDKPTRLGNLGSSFFSRFERLREPGDLEEAISRQQNAIDLTPNGHPYRPGFLSDLGNSFVTRFERLGKLSDLEQAISRQLDAIDLTPGGHPDKPGFMNNLSMSFFTRFECLGDLHDLEEAISVQRNVVGLKPSGHPDEPGYLNNLGNSLFCRFESLGELSDLEEAILRQQDAVDLTPDGHPSKPGFLNNLGHSLKARFYRLGVSGDLEQALSLYSNAACAPTGPIAFRFHASQLWIHCARLLEHHSLLHAYSAAMLLVPQFAWVGLSLADRYRELIQSADVVREAAAAALELGHPETAVEWLEQGRSVVWGELLRLRSSYDELSSAHPDHARRLQELSVTLENASTARERFLSSPTEKIDNARHRTRSEVDRQHALAIERDTLLRDIRTLPGFERFFLQKDFSQLRVSAHSGPIVILNATQTRCDALIILANVDHAIHVPFRNFTFERSQALQSSLKSLVRLARDISQEGREGRPKPQERSGEWETILAPLWKSVVKPVLDALAFSTTGDPSRIFWCPTGPFIFLPIHAAGFYDVHHSEPGHRVYDFVISSYIPTLATLAPLPERDHTTSGDLCLLAVRQPSSDGQRELPGVIAELEHIKRIIKQCPSARTTLIESSLGTVEEVLSLMKEASWVHFACHGIQDDDSPTESGLCLADQRRLKLSDMISLSRPRGGLAFLSACQTAKGDRKLYDEAIHVAAGMLFAGYGGVVGTMWSISDTFAPDVAKDIYEQLFRSGEKPDYREAARALHVAIGRLRENDRVSFQDWIPFIHVGL